MLFFTSLILLFQSMSNFTFKIIQIYWILFKNLIIFSSQLFELLLDSINLFLKLIDQRAPVFFSILLFSLKLPLVLLYAKYKFYYIYRYFLSSRCPFLLKCWIICFFYPHKCLISSFLFLILLSMSFYFNMFLPIYSIYSPI